MMKDGAIVQIGTPEAIITQPVDDFSAPLAKMLTAPKFSPFYQLFVK